MNTGNGEMLQHLLREFLGLSVISILRCSRRGREIFPRTSVPRHRFSGAWSGLRAFEGPQTRANIDEGAVPNSVSVGSENAARLTSFRGVASHPRLSPDGAHVAFSGNYKGQTDVHVVPIDGDTPTRLTWHPRQRRGAGVGAGRLARALHLGPR